jgi:hypothetical protein
VSFASKVLVHCIEEFRATVERGAGLEEQGVSGILYFKLRIFAGLFFFDFGIWLEILSCKASVGDLGILEVNLQF